MTEDQARQVLLLQACEQAGGPAHAHLHARGALHAAAAAAAHPHWSADDRAWATRQAIAAVGDKASPDTFVAARAAVAMQRLLPRDDAARRWLERRAWHRAWVWLAAVLGLVAGLLVDQLGPPQHVNLLAPAVWAVVAWNLCVYAAALLPWPGGGGGGGGNADSSTAGAGGAQGVAGSGVLQRGLARLAQGRGDTGAALLWARHAAPLSLARAGLLLHVASALLALGLMAGLYLRGLVLDYRAGWQSTFLDAATVQWLLHALLAPASAITGIAVPDVAGMEALRVGPGAPAQASAAPWIHLVATTLALWVMLPRAVLALWSGLRARALSRRFPLPLDTPYFEALHPLMRPGLSRTVRLLWAALPGLAPVRLLGQTIDELVQPTSLLDTDQGEELLLCPAPAAGALDRAARPQPARAWWRRDTGPPPLRLQQLRAQTDAVLWVAPPGAPPPAWLTALQRPVIVLQDGGGADAAGTSGSSIDPPALPLRHLQAGWLPDGRWLQALQDAMPDDLRVQRLVAAWTARQQTLFDADVAALAASLGRIGAARVALADDGLLARRAAAETAQQALGAALQQEWRDSAAAAKSEAHAGAAASAASPSASGTLGTAVAPDHSHSHSHLPTEAALRHRVGEGSAALMGGVTTGALAGLKADLATGGMTMGAGLVAGAVIGALTAAGLARGVNVVRGTDRSFAAWDAQALAMLTEAWLLRRLVRHLVSGPDGPDGQDGSAARATQAARGALQAALAAHHAAWSGVWAGRSQRSDNPGEAERLAQALRAPLAAVLRDALARLHPPAQSVR